MSECGASEKSLNAGDQEKNRVPSKITITFAEFTGFGQRNAEKHSEQKHHFVTGDVQLQETLIIQEMSVNE